MDISVTPTIERIARVLAAQRTADWRATPDDDEHFADAVALL
jgi:hypothetical protein